MMDNLARHAIIFNLEKLQREAGAKLSQLDCPLALGFFRLYLH
jgi:hypothetical protein